MELKDIITALEKADVGADVVEAVKDAADTSAVDAIKRELDAEKGKTKAVLDDKRKFKERAENAEKQLKELEEGKMTDEEKSSKRLQELEDQLKTAEAERQKQEAEFASERREARLADITGTVRWAEGVPHDTAKLIVKQTLSDVDDLSDQSTVDAKVKELIENHKSFVAAEAPAGAGGTSGGSGGGGEDEPATMKDLISEVWQGK